MDKKLAVILGSLILVVISFVVAIIIYFTKDRIRILIPNDLRISDNQWIIGVTIFLVIGILALMVCVTLLHRGFFKPNRDHYLWKRFWIGFLLYSLKHNHQDFSNFDKIETSVQMFIEGFISKYNTLANEISNSLKDIDSNVEFIAWLENKIEEVEQTPSILFPPSLSTITAFYGFALLIAGSLGSLIINPATDLLRYITNFFL